MGIYGMMGAAGYPSTSGGQIMGQEAMVNPYMNQWAAMMGYYGGGGAANYGGAAANYAYNYAGNGANYGAAAQQYASMYPGMMGNGMMGTVTPGMSYETTAAALPVEPTSRSTVPPLPEEPVAPPPVDDTPAPPSLSTDASEIPPWQQDQSYQSFSGASNFWIP